MNSFFGRIKRPLTLSEHGISNLLFRPLFALSLKDDCVVAGETVE